MSVLDYKIGPKALRRARRAERSVRTQGQMGLCARRLCLRRLADQPVQDSARPSRCFLADAAASAALIPPGSSRPGASARILCALPLAISVYPQECPSETIRSVVAPLRVPTAQIYSGIPKVRMRFVSVWISRDQYRVTGDHPGF